MDCSCSQVLREAKPQIIWGPIWDLRAADSLKGAKCTVYLAVRLCTRMYSALSLSSG